MFTTLSAQLKRSFGENFQGAILFSKLENIAFQEAGVSAFSIATNLRTSIIIESGSILIGQASTQALQVVQAITSSFKI